MSFTRPDTIEIGYATLEEVCDGDSHFNVHISTLGLETSFAFFTSEENSTNYSGPYFTIWDRFVEHDKRNPFEVGYAYVEIENDLPVVHLCLDGPMLPQPMKAIMVPGSKTKGEIPDYLKDDPSRLKYWCEWDILWKRHQPNKL